VEEFFYNTHPFSDLTLIVQATASKIFQSYLQDNLDTIEILDVTPNETIEMLKFLYPQFECTINNDNVTVLLILSQRFELELMHSACRTFILLYLSKLEHIDLYDTVDGNKFNELIELDDGCRLSVGYILGVLTTWFREFYFSKFYLLSRYRSLWRKTIIHVFFST
ncbi:unnamed protein product, partial [Didymodactylos carnosus]